MKRTVFFLSSRRTVKRLLLPILLCLPVFSGAIAGNQDDQNKEGAVALFEQANILYTQGELQQAIERYSNIINKYGISAPLLYNLANTYTAAGQVGPAILNYERALHLAPGDTDIQGNLAQVRKDAGLYRDDQPFYRQLTDLLGADQWLMIAGCAFFCLGISSLLIRLTAGREKRPLYWMMTGSLTVLLCTLPPAVFRYRDWNIGIVLAEDAHLLISPFADAVPEGNIKAGRLVRPERMHGDYVLVKTETGKSGWLAKDSFALLTEELVK